MQNFVGCFWGTLKVSALGCFPACSEQSGFFLKNPLVLLVVSGFFKLRDGTFFQRAVFGIPTFSIYGPFKGTFMGNQQEGAKFLAVDPSFCTKKVGFSCSRGAWGSFDNGPQP